MDAGRFDSISRSFARRKSRRAAIQSLGAAGLVAALGVEPASAASGNCSMHIVAKTSVGSNANKTYSGTLNFSIGDNGAIDTGTFDLDDGSSLSLVGQATGRAINLRISLADQSTLAFVGAADIDLLLCRGDASGVFGGPDDSDIGTWHTGNGGSSSGSSGTTNNSGSTTSSSGTTTGSGGSSGGGNSSGGGCASGVVCNGVCCAPAPGLSADNITCNAGACECTYSCASAGCGGGDGSIVNTCGSDPEPHCHSECNVPDDNGCGDVTCENGQDLDLDSCTCIPSGDACGGADLVNDPANCGACGVVCGALEICSDSSCTDVCAISGLVPCNGTCVDTANDPNNCGSCGFSCAGRSLLGICVGGGCA